MNKLFGILGCILIVIFSYLTSLPLFGPGYFPMHDDTQVTRVDQMTKAIEDGMFPVRWTKDLGYGYGYPIFNFYAPFAYYVGSGIQLLGNDAVTAAKVMMALALMTAGVTMYFLGKSLWGIPGGIVSSLFYLFAPYHAALVYVRGAIAEAWAYAFVPLALYGLWKVYETRKWRYVIVGAVGLAGVAVSHNLTTLMMLPFYAILSLLLIVLLLKRSGGFAWLLLPIMGGAALLLSAFYWLPAVTEMHYTNVASQIEGGSKYADHYVCPLQLWDSMWGFGGSVPGCVDDGMSFRAGKIHIVVAIVAFIAGIMFIRSDNARRGAVILALIGAILSVFFLLPFSKVIWDAVSPLAYIQFPWRLLLFVSFFTSILAGTLCYIAGKMLIASRVVSMLPILIGGVLSALVIYINFDLFKPQTIVAADVPRYTDVQSVRWDISKISDEYMPKNFAKPKRKEDLIKNRITSIESIPSITVDPETTTGYDAFVQSRVPVELLLNTAYFPAWKLYIDNEPASYTVRNDGLLVAMPAGEHTLSLVFEETDIEKLANWLSLSGVAVLFLGIIIAWRKHFL